MVSPSGIPRLLEKRHCLLSPATVKWNICAAPMHSESHYVFIKTYDTCIYMSTDITRSLCSWIMKTLLTESFYSAGTFFSHVMITEKNQWAEHEHIIKRRKRRLCLRVCSDTAYVSGYFLLGFIWFCFTCLKERK